VNTFQNTVTICVCVGRAMAQVVSRRPLTVEARIRARASPCRICGARSSETVSRPSDMNNVCMYRVAHEMIPYFVRHPVCTCMEKLFVVVVKHLFI
jgi:hypothetical protein